MDNLRHWRDLKQPPTHALKQIGGGRLKGKTDINPQWRYEAMTREFGPCGIGWKYEIERVWTEQGSGGEVFAFASVKVYVKDGEGWSEPIPGIGGHFLVEKESNGLHNNDEAFKMATTDALSVALKMLGVAADIYAGLWDGAKYRDVDTKKPLGDPPFPYAKTNPVDAAIVKELGGEEIVPKISPEVQAFLDGSFDAIREAKTLDELKKAWAYVQTTAKAGAVPEYFMDKLRGQKDAKKAQLGKA